MKKLLLIEDDKSTAQSYAAEFTDEYEVCISKNGEDGLNDALEILPDIILLDVMLPGKMNGFDVLRELKNTTKTMEIPVIILTNLDDQKKAALESGAVDCFVKANTNIDEVSAVIRTVLQHTDIQKSKQKSK